jgi:hypothetical protein
VRAVPAGRVGLVCAGFVLAYAALAAIKLQDWLLVALFVFWAGAPLMGHYALADSVRNSGPASAMNLAATVAAGAASFAVYCVVLPWAGAPAGGKDVMNCGAPLGEESAWLIRLPLLHWLCLGPLTLAALALRSLHKR